ncbi:VWA domain-containing protein [Hyphomicrobium sp.]|uniref:VWA domain-containing protein n=1 Tax=Hyphomicrobium sp. TaxID=82 RepID=UPI003F725DEC
MLMLHRCASFLVLASVWALLATAPAQAEDAPSDGPAIIVIDGSGSMWGNVGTEKPSKFDLARGALRQSLSGLSPRVRLGLMSFGHRRRADCSDVEVILPPEAGPPERVLSLVDKLSPKGKGPLALTLAEAAKQIPAGEHGSIIVVHDGVDNCWQDPCATAATIAKANANIRVFLIGFGLEPGDAQRLQCVADATNGRVIEAQSSSALADSISDALTLANLERVDAATGIAVPVPKAAKPPTPAGAPGVRLTASLSPDGPPLTAAVAWTLSKTGDNGALLKSTRGKDFSADLEPGSYVVEARFGQASQHQTVEVTAAGPTTATISLGAGYLKLNSLADKAGAALGDPLITVTAKDSADADGAPLWIGRDASARLVLPAGTYRVRVQDGLAEQTSEVTVTEGTNSEARPVLGTGRLELSAVSAANGEPLQAVTYAVEEDDPDSPQGRREIVRSAAPVATFTLPAGTYYVSARSGVAEVHQRIALGSGDVVKNVSSFNLVPITISVVTGQAADASDASHPILIRVLSADATPREIARAHSAVGTFRLPPARYRVEAMASGLNIAARGTIDLTTGKGGTTQLKLEHGEVTVGSDGAPGAYWRVKDDAGRTVMHSGPGRPKQARLAPGRYTLLTEVEGRRIERAFDLKAGEQQSIPVVAP